MSLELKKYIYKSHNIQNQQHLFIIYVTHNRIYGTCLKINIIIYQLKNIKHI